MKDLQLPNELLGQIQRWLKIYKGIIFEHGIVDSQIPMISKGSGSNKIFQKLILNRFFVLSNECFWKKKKKSK